MISSIYSKQHLHHQYSLCISYSVQFLNLFLILVSYRRRNLCKWLHYTKFQFEVLHSSRKGSCHLYRLRNTLYGARNSHWSRHKLGHTLARQLQPSHRLARKGTLIDVVRNLDACVSAYAPLCNWFFKFKISKYCQQQDKSNNKLTSTL